MGGVIDYNYILLKLIKDLHEIYFIIWEYFHIKEYISPNLYLPSNSFAIIESKSFRTYFMCFKFTFSIDSFFHYFNSTLLQNSIIFEDNINFIISFKLFCSSGSSFHIFQLTHIKRVLRGQNAIRIDNENTKKIDILVNFSSLLYWSIYLICWILRFYRLIFLIVI